jgi:hypothetical protein
VFWGVQYHPELDLYEVAGALRRQSDQLVGRGMRAALRPLRSMLLLLRNSIMLPLERISRGFLGSMSRSRRKSAD